MQHLMLDFETLGTQEHTAVLSLGAVLFDAQRGFLNQKYWVFDVDAQLPRRSVTFSTLQWWMKQSAQAKNVFTEPHVRTQLSDWTMETRDILADYPDVRVWGNAASFDVSIAENIFRQFNQQAPWKFWASRCYRTLKNIHPIEQGIERKGTHHNALDDAVYQAECLMRFLKEFPFADK